MTRKRASRGKRLTYGSAGVDLARGDRVSSSAARAAKRTHDRRVLALPQGYSGAMTLARRDGRRWKEPVLFACTDSVGTKVVLARELGRVRGLGADVVAMNVDDLVVHGAEPMLFLDYLAASRLNETLLGDVLAGIAAACRKAGCALLGGETAEMPGVYAEGEFDVVGSAVGVAEHREVISRETVRSGDVLLGLASSGVHSNGFSLVRKILDRDRAALDRPLPGTRTPLADAILAPTRIYAPSVRAMLIEFRAGRDVRGMCHVTGGGLPRNLERMLPKGCAAEVDRAAWHVPPLFRWLQETGRIAEGEMLRTFNMGIGYVVAVRSAVAAHVEALLKSCGERVVPIGRVAKRKRGAPAVRFIPPPR